MYVMGYKGCVYFHESINFKMAAKANGPSLTQKLLYRYLANINILIYKSVVVAETNLQHWEQPSTIWIELCMTLHEAADRV